MCSRVGGNQRTKSNLFPYLLWVGEVARHEDGHLHGDHNSGGDTDQRPETSHDGRVRPYHVRDAVQ